MNWPNASILRSAGLVVLVLVAAATLLSNFGQIQSTHVTAQTTLGGALPGLTSGQLSHFTLGQTQFNFPWDPVHGLGPVYTQTKCNLCHIKTATAGPISGGFNGDSSFFNTLVGQTQQRRQLQPPDQ